MSTIAIDLARFQDPSTREWWRLRRSDARTCALESISERSLERGLGWAFACDLTIARNEHVTPERVRAEMEAYLAMGARHADKDSP